MTNDERETVVNEVAKEVLGIHMLKMAGNVTVSRRMLEKALQAAFSEGLRNGMRNGICYIPDKIGQKKRA